VTNLYFTVQH